MQIDALREFATRRQSEEAPGQFVAGSIHGAWMDTDGSLYTAEASRHSRLQKFVRV